MASPAMLSLEAFRDAQRCVEIRQRLHARCDPWLDTLAARVKAPQPTLAELPQAVFILRQALTHVVTEGLVEPAQRALVEQRALACPQCGHLVSARGPAERTVETLVGAIRLRRPDVGCERCQLGTAPVDAALELSHRRQQPDLQQAAVRLTQGVPDETDGAPTREALAAKLSAVAAGQPWRPILVRAMDGAAGPTRPETAHGRRRGRQKARATRAHWAGEWREANGCRVYLRAAERIEHLLSWHPVQTEVELGAARQQVNTAGLIPEAQVRRCVIADGAPWLWTQVRARFPSAVESLADDHCGAHLSKVAARQYRDHPERPYEWCEAAVARLCWGEGHWVIWGLQRMKPTDAQAAAAIDKLISDLPRHQERLDDRVARTGGYPIGSGAIESAHTFSGHVRLKRSGAWWDWGQREPEARLTLCEIHPSLRASV